MLSWVEHGNSFITLGPDQLHSAIKFQHDIQIVIKNVCRQMYGQYNGVIHLVFENRPTKTARNNKSLPIHLKALL